MNPDGSDRKTTPLGNYQGMTDQVVLSRTPGSFRTVLVPRLEQTRMAGALRASFRTEAC